MKKFKIKDLYCGMKGYNVKWVKVFKVFDRFDSIGTDLATRIIKKKKQLLYTRLVLGYSGFCQ